MTNNKQERATKVALNETGSIYEVKELSANNDNNVSRNFSITDLWSIRRNARSFKIHNRIPRL